MQCMCSCVPSHTGSGLVYAVQMPAKFQQDMSGGSARHACRRVSEPSQPASFPTSLWTGQTSAPRPAKSPDRHPKWRGLSFRTCGEAASTDPFPSHLGPAFGSHTPGTSLRSWEVRRGHPSLCLRLQCCCPRHCGPRTEGMDLPLPCVTAGSFRALRTVASGGPLRTPRDTSDELAAPEPVGRQAGALQQSGSLKTGERVAPAWTTPEGKTRPGLPLRALWQSSMDFSNSLRAGWLADQPSWPSCLVGELPVFQSASFQAARRGEVLSTQAARQACCQARRLLGWQAAKQASF